MATVSWDLEDWDIVEDALKDFADSLRECTPKELEMSQEDYDKKTLRVRSLIAESRNKYMDEYLLWKQANKALIEQQQEEEEED